MKGVDNLLIKSQKISFNHVGCLSNMIKSENFGELESPEVDSASEKDQIGGGYNYDLREDQCSSLDFRADNSDDNEIPIEIQGNKTGGNAAKRPTNLPPVHGSLSGSCDSTGLSRCDNEKRKQVGEENQGDFVKVTRRKEGRSKKVIINEQKNTVHYVTVHSDYWEERAYRGYVRFKTRAKLVLDLGKIKPEEQLGLLLNRAGVRIFPGRSSILVKYENKKEKKLLLSVDRLEDVPVVSSGVRYVIMCVRNVPEEVDINKIESISNCLSARRVYKWRGNQKLSTGIVSLKYMYGTAPPDIQIGNLKFQLKKSLRCFNCKKYGHKMNSCLWAPKCRNDNQTNKYNVPNRICTLSESAHADRCGEMCCQVPKKNRFSSETKAKTTNQAMRPTRKGTNQGDKFGKGNSESEAVECPLTKSRNNVSVDNEQQLSEVQNLRRMEKLNMRFEIAFSPVLDVKEVPGKAENKQTLMDDLEQVIAVVTQVLPKLKDIKTAFSAPITRESIKDAAEPPVLSFHC